MPEPRRLFGRRPLLLALGGLAVVTLTACGSSGKPSSSQTQASKGASPVAGRASAPAAGATLQPVIAASELVVGPNRFTMGILDRGGAPIPDAKVHVKFFRLASAPGSGGSAQGVLKAEADTTFRSPGREAGLPAVETVVRPDGTKILVQSGSDDVGVYETEATFDAAGDWGVEADVTGKDAAHSGVVRTAFKVLPQGTTPAVGSPAPRSHNLTVNDVSDLSIIDTSAHPSPDMHTETIADAIAAGHPTLVIFATPGYCTSRLCGPELELALKLVPQYQGKADFIHVEIYKDPVKREVMPTVAEWHLQSEPWFFVIDRSGIITAKFEGPTTLEELDAALQKVVS